MIRYVLSVLADTLMVLAVLLALAAVGGILGMKDDNSGAVASCMKQYNVEASQCP